MRMEYLLLYIPINIDLLLKYQTEAMMSDISAFKLVDELSFLIYE